MTRIDEGADEAGGMPADVTHTSRITVTRRRAAVLDSAETTLMRGIDWGAVMSSVVSGMALTATLVILGVATGLIAGDENTSGEEAAGILGAIEAWTIVAMIVGSFAGAFVGGRLTRWLDRAGIAGHALTAWGVTTLLGIALASLVSIGFATTTTSAAATAAAAEQATGQPADPAAAPAEGDQAATGAQARGGDAADAEERADEAADALGGAGVALAVGMLLSLLAAFGGWWLGSRKPLTSLEREDDTATV